MAFPDFDLEGAIASEFEPGSVNLLTLFISSDARNSRQITLYGMSRVHHKPSQVRPV